MRDRVLRAAGAGLERGAAREACRTAPVRRMRRRLAWATAAAILLLAALIHEWVLSSRLFPVEPPAADGARAERLALAAELQPFAADPESVARWIELTQRRRSARPVRFNLGEIPW